MDQHEQQRCGWVNLNEPLYVAYHDDEWGLPCHDEHKLFEMLCLEGAQAGLSWITILKKRENYRAAFDDFDPEQIARYDEEKVAALLNNPGIVRNRLKVNASSAMPALTSPCVRAVPHWTRSCGVSSAGSRSSTTGAACVKSQRRHPNRRP